MRLDPIFAAHPHAAHAPKSHADIACRHRTPTSHADIARRFDAGTFACRLSAHGTLEEGIRERQRRKRELANAVLDAEGGRAAAIGPDDLRVLFALP